MNEFFSRKLFQVDGMTFTVGISIVVLIVIWFLFFRK